MSMSLPYERVSLCFADKHNYEGILPPYHPPDRYPELALLPEGDGLLCRENLVYEAVRASLRMLGLDASRADTPCWNPLGDLVSPGGTVVIKPNLVRHYNGNPAGTLDSVLTHGSVLRPLVDYALRALDGKGRIVIADAPQHDGDMEAMKRSLGIAELQDFYRTTLGFDLEFLDLRVEWVIYRDGIIVERFPLPGDPLGYSLVDLGQHSEFADPGVDPRRLRGSEYDSQETIAGHSDGSHGYLLSNTVLGADLVINVPKVKTHKKAGVTLALKNLFGVNGNKNLLPHHSLGFPHQGGDEFPAPSPYRRLRSQLIDWSRPVLKRGRLRTLFRAARRAEGRLLSPDPTRSGNWHGNDTVWRTIVDLNKAFYCTDRHGMLQDRPVEDRKHLVVFDGIVAGEGNGPMETDDRPTGLICAGLDPIAADLALIRLMGFDWRRVRKVARSVALEEHRFTRIREERDVRLNVLRSDGTTELETPLPELDLNLHFRPHVGWTGHIERTDEEERALDAFTAVAGSTR
jgi:uncharacterized protein (DUF362 family)